MDGATLTPLKQFADDRGKVMHMLREHDPHFEQFGEIYFSWTNPGIIKGWHRHKIKTVNLSVPAGKVKFVTVQNDETHEFILGEDNYGLLTIQPGIWYAFQCLSDAPSMIANCATHPHDPDGSETKLLKDIHYDWNAS